MDAVLTILIWLGSGFAFAVGVALGVFVMRQRDSTEMADLMRERNELDRQKIEAMNRIEAKL